MAKKVRATVGFNYGRENSRVEAGATADVPDATARWVVNAGIGELVSSPKKTPVKKPASSPSNDGVHDGAPKRRKD